MFRYQRYTKTFYLNSVFYIHELIYQFTKINILNSQRIKINSRVEVQLITDVYFKFKLKGKLYKD